MPGYVFRLYITGQSPRSRRAAANLQKICESYLGADFELTVIDVRENPELAEAANIFATPATVRVAPPPVLKVIGDLSDPARTMAALGIEPDPDAPASKEET